ncbi:MAG: hypothetical protein DMF64_13375 [Acidobacteria bacterium]|nr:MAG: hypothetical protein DMF64_13375 [Acidobacteriota bacterium]
MIKTPPRVLFRFGTPRRRRRAHSLPTDARLIKQKRDLFKQRAATDRALLVGTKFAVEAYSLSLACA